MSTAMSQSVARVATIHQPATSRRRTVRRAVVTRAEASRDDVEVSTLQSRRFMLVGLASVPALPALAATELKGTPVTATNAYIALMDGRDAIVSAMELQGLEEGGRRSRVQNLLPRFAEKAAVMTALLPAVMRESYGEVGGGPEGSESVPEDKLGQMEDILVGAKNLTVLAKYVADSTPFVDSDIPQVTFETAIAAIDRTLIDGDPEAVKKAKAERCRRLISKAADMEEMKLFAQSKTCEY
tara:strand:- start:849 stop:1571 length:723 start_codon:yes stop_codon:yes gene_type:complete